MGDTTAENVPMENLNLGDSEPAPAAPARKKYTFTKRDPEKAAKLEEERKATIKKNPFGDAKPRESVIAQRTGKDEQALLAEEANEYEVKVRLTPEQQEQKRAKVSEIKAIQNQIEGAEEEQATELQERVTQMEAELQTMLKEFEADVIAKAKAGELPRPERRVQGDDESAQGGGYQGGDEFGANFGSATFSHASGRGGGAGGGGGRRYNDGGGGGGGGGYSQGRQDYGGGGRQGGGGGSGYGRRPEDDGDAFANFSNRNRQNRMEGGGSGGGGYQGGGGGGGGYQGRSGSGFGDRQGGGGNGGGAQDVRFPAGDDESDYRPLGERRT